MENLQIEVVKNLLKNNQRVALHKLLLDTNPVDIAELMDDLTG